MRTCWVLDHPAHVRLLAPFLREGSTADLIVACERSEVRAMLEQGDGRLPRRQTLWVPRPVGEGRKRKAVYRLRSVQRFLKAAGQDGQGPVERIVGVGAALEMMAAKPRWWRRSTVRERWYITDTEVNHLAHRLATKSATHVVVPTHWRADLDGGFLASFGGTVHRLDGLHGHVHLAPHRRPSAVSSPPRVLVRRLVGGGVHDGDEIVALPEDALDGLMITNADENGYEGEAWRLDRELAAHDGVITQSVTLASEAAADADLAADNERAANLEPIRKFSVSKIRQQSDALRDVGPVEQRARRWQGFGSKNNATLAELLVTFFTHFRAVEPLWRHGLVASTYAGRWVAGCSWAPGRYCLGVEDPFSAGDNVARAVQRRSLPKVLSAVRDGTLAVGRVVCIWWWTMLIPERPERVTGIAWSSRRLPSASSTVPMVEKPVM